MKYSTALALAISMISSGTAFAQKPTTKPEAKTDSVSAALIGTWEGGVYSDHAPESLLRMTFAKGATMKVTISIVSNGQEFASGESADVKIEGNGVTWAQGLMGQSCKGSGVLIAGALKGDIMCGEHGVTYLAKKK